MILFTSGFPQAGKTELSHKISLKTDDVIHINPKDFYLEEFEKLPDNVKSAVAISAWEMAMECAHDHIVDKSNDTLIIFDTCCSNEYSMRVLFTNAKYSGHRVYYVFVASPQEDRQRRSPNTDLSQYESKYKSEFIKVLPALKELSDYFLWVTNNNEDGLEKLDKCAEIIVQDVEKIRNS